MMTFPKTAVDRFFNEHWPSVKDGHLRLGQSFHQFMKLEKITSDEKIYCDRLYEADGAKAMTAERTDSAN